MPTLFTDVDPDSEIAQREIFGPVLCLFKFSDEDQGVALANSTEYGLAAYVQTNDLNVAQRMSRRLRAGSVFVNQATPSTLPRRRCGTDFQGLVEKVARRSSMNSFARRALR
jgi:aldehyde dehydrogenase (NAD+)